MQKECLSETAALLLLRRNPQPFHIAVALGRRILKQKKAPGVSRVYLELQKHYENLCLDNLVEKEDRGRSRFYWLSVNGLQVRQELLNALATTGQVLEINDIFQKWREEDGDES